MKIILLLSLVTRCISIDRFPWYDTSLPLETRLDTLINEMTFQEKISQTPVRIWFWKIRNVFEQIRRHRIWGRSSVSSGYRTTCNAESFHSKGMCGMEKFAAAKYYDFLEIENPSKLLHSAGVPNSTIFPMPMNMGRS